MTVMRGKRLERSSPAPCPIIEQWEKSTRSRLHSRSSPSLSRMTSAGDIFSRMGTPANEEYATFEDKVKRTVYLDDLSPKVTASVLKTALGQFGTVISTYFIPNYTKSMRIPQCALVEMETAKLAQSAIAEMTMHPFMMCGMPRPVRARPAKVGMFADHPARPSRKITCHWLDSKDPDFEVAKKLKSLTRRHAAEASVLLKQQLEQEEKLAKKQAELLKRTYKMYEKLDRLTTDRSLNRLGHYYNIVPDA